MLLDGKNEALGCVCLIPDTVDGKAHTSSSGKQYDEL